MRRRPILKSSWLAVLVSCLAATTAVALAAPPAGAAPLTTRGGATALNSASIGFPLGSLTGLAGNLVSPVTGGTNPLSTLTAGAGALAGLGLSAFSSWVLDGAKAALQETAGVISHTTAPHLESTWFSSAYWRVAGLAALLTLPFLFAAAAQSLVRSDLGLLLRAAFGYLPLALIGVSLAAPVTMLLLAVTDEMCAVIAGAGAGGGVHFLRQTAVAIAGLDGFIGSPFLGFAIGLLTVAAAIALAIEMLIREAAVYVVVLMLPLAFAALVWPARRAWAIRLVELIIALILSKFAIVAVLSLAGAAYGTTGTPSATRLLTAMTLVMLSTFAPWTMLRLLPFTELAAGAAGAIRAEVPRLAKVPMDALSAAEGPVAWAESLAHTLSGRSDPGNPPADVSGSGDQARARTADEPFVTRPWATSSGATNATLTAPGAAGPAASTPISSEERLPGMDRIWQAGDSDWPPTVLDLEGYAGPSAYRPAVADSATPALSEPPGGPAAEEELPLPPSQRDEEGRL